MLFITFTARSQAQTITPSVINTTGNNNIVVDNIQFEISVGEIAVTTLPYQQSTITQGLLQPRYVISTPTIELSNGQKITVFPNPTSNELHIEMSDLKIIEKRILDTSGKILIMDKNDTPSILVNELLSGNYILQIFSLSNQPISIKFIKN